MILLKRQRSAFSSHQLNLFWLWVRDVGGLEAAVAQPRMTFDAKDLYPDLASKAAALCISLVANQSVLIDESSC